MDLNLLPIFARLLATGSATRTAAALGLGVPAVSRALARLRVELGDPLFVRAGRGLVPTPRARALAGEVEAALGAVARLRTPAAAQPLRSVRRELRLACTDGVAALFAGPLAAALAREAPLLQLRFVAEENETPDALRTDRVDLALGGALRFPAEIKVRQAGTERLVGLARRDHPDLAGRAATRRLAARPQVVAATQVPFAAAAARAWRRAGLERRVALETPSFFSAAAAVAESDFIATAPRLVARRLAECFPLAVFELPVALPPIPVRLAWHPRHDLDPAHRWLRDRLFALLRARLAAA